MRRRFDNEWALRKATKEAMTTDIIEEDSAKNLVKHVTTLQTLSGQLLQSTFTEMVLAGYETEIIDREGNATPLTAEELPKIAIDVQFEYGHPYLYLHKQGQPISLKRKWTSAGSRERTLEDADQGISVSDLNVLYRDVDLTLSTVANTQEYLALEAKKHLIKGEIELEEILEKAIIGDMPTAAYTWTRMERLAANIINVTPPDRELAISRTLLEEFVLASIALGKTDIAFSDIVKKTRGGGRMGGGMGIIGTEMGGVRKNFSTAEEENNALHQKMFGLSAGEKELLAKINRLILPTTTQGEWQRTIVGDTLQLPTLEHNGITLTSYVPTEVKDIMITVDGVAQKQLGLALAVPEQWHLTNVSFGSNYDIGKLYAQRDYEIVYNNQQGAYFLLFTTDGEAKLGSTRQLMYSANATLGHEKKYLPAQPLDKQKVMSVIDRLQVIGLVTLADNLTYLIDQHMLTTTGLEAASQASFVYSIRGPEENNAQAYKPGTFEYQILDTLLGIDADTGKIRVQCTHAAELGRVLLEEVLPDAVLQQTHIDQLQTVPLMERGEYRNEMGPLHEAIRLSQADTYSVFDATPPMDEAYINQERKRDRQTGKGRMEVVLANPEIQNSLVTSARDAFYEAILTTPQAADLEGQDTRYQFQRILNKSVSELARVAMVFDFTSQHYFDMTEEERKRALHILAQFTEVGHVLQELPIDQRETKIKEVEASQLSRSREGIKENFLMTVVSIAAQLQQYLQIK